ncbi:MAG TPA: hypothetical protein VLQ45_20590 [Thermoanaerobaculia bacterium]|nr:hypothetical protein [Thermoanaerobaculia bacterium]
MLAFSFLLVFVFGSVGVAQAKTRAADPSGSLVQATDPAVVTLPARGGNGNGGTKPPKPDKPPKPGNGNGNGNGGNGNGNNGGNNGGGRGELTFEIKPATWNLNWEHAEGNVQAFVRGADADEIDLDSVELTVEAEGDAEGDAIEPKSVRYAGKQVVATFSKSEAIELLGDDAEAGDKVTLVLSFTVGEGEDAEEKELTDQIRVVGKPDDDDDDGEGEEDEVSLNIQPDDWNTNWARTSGQVHVFLRGDGLADIDLDSIRLVGDDAEAEPLKPLNVRRVGKQIVARFSKRAAYATLDDPDTGETHVVKVRYSAGEGEDAEEKELSEDIKIVGP